MIKKRIGKKGRVFMVLLMLLCYLAPASATKIELGSIPGNNVQTIYPGESGTFTVSFFNMGKDPITLTTELEYDREIGVEAAPTELILERDINRNKTLYHKSYYLVGDTAIPLHEVKVYVYVPDEVSKKTYRIKLIATAKSTDSDEITGYGQTMAQTREFTFTVKTLKTAASSSGGEEDDVEYDTGPKRTGFLEDGEEDLTTDDKETVKKGSGSGNQIHPDIGSGTSPGGGTPYVSKTRDSAGDDDGGFLGISRDDEGNTNINLPVGKVVLDEKQTETAVDIGLITLIISVLSLAVRIIK